jgi:hypothetical protein
MPVPVNVEKERGVQTFYRRRSTATGLVQASTQWTSNLGQTYLP